MGESDMNNVPIKDNLAKQFSGVGIVYVMQFYRCFPINEEVRRWCVEENP